MDNVSNKNILFFSLHEKDTTSKQILEELDKNKLLDNQFIKVCVYPNFRNINIPKKILELNKVPVLIAPGFSEPIMGDNALSWIKNNTFNTDTAMGLESAELGTSNFSSIYASLEEEFKSTDYNQHFNSDYNLGFGQSKSNNPNEFMNVKENSQIVTYDEGDGKKNSSDQIKKRMNQLIFNRDRDIPRAPQRIGGLEDMQDAHGSQNLNDMMRPSGNNNVFPPQPDFRNGFPNQPMMNNNNPGFPNNNPGFPNQPMMNNNNPGFPPRNNNMGFPPANNMGNNNMRQQPSNNNPVGMGFPPGNNMNNNQSDFPMMNNNNSRQGFPNQPPGMPNRMQPINDRVFPQPSNPAPNNSNNKNSASNVQFPQIPDGMTNGMLPGMLENFSSNMSFRPDSGRNTKDSAGSFPSPNNMPGFVGSGNINTPMSMGTPSRMMKVNNQ